MDKEEQKKVQDILMDKKLVPYFDQIFQFYQDLGKIKGTSKKISAITPYLMIFQDITQKDLKTLSGYSLANISNTLNMLQNLNIVEKIRIPNTHTYQYKIPGKFEDSIKQSIIMTHKYVESTIQFLHHKNNKLSKPEFNSLRGSKEIKNQLSSNILQLKLINQVLDEFLISLEEENPLKVNNSLEKNFELFKPKILPSEYQFIEYDNKIKLIELDIIKFLQKTLFQRIKGASKSLLMPYFITRFLLTQKDLKKVSGLSIGQISDGLNELMNSGMISFVINLVSSSNSNRPIKVYYMRSLSLSIIVRLRHIFDRIFESKANFIEMKEELDSEKLKLHNLLGYKEIYNYITEFINLIKKYENFNKFLQQIERIAISP
ncbi:hypothetical protein DSAG12_00136 [Promethearchaeum syntrophicum]|uniref:Uncharacterized protein n=1 Tax=Promethearchaeum syntrophicum TaxID=2594042 RepID=A0A5B9D5R6_9ARCH|nr:hypothetical protein [Candidatus Prometheoarchaeum syntrophicum]QEE14323.1 hypothetical protein DSAG12_00136 [Candidatus Prometheoarchaeum syntrophicum]